jgi:hypothetical protein
MTKNATTATTTPISNARPRPPAQFAAPPNVARAIRPTHTSSNTTTTGMMGSSISQAMFSISQISYMIDSLCRW